MSRPFTRTSPEVGVISPAMQRNSVVFPHPDGPRGYELAGFNRKVDRAQGNHGTVAARQAANLDGGAFLLAGCFAGGVHCRPTGREQRRTSGLRASRAPAERPSQARSEWSKPPRQTDHNCRRGSSGWTPAAWCRMSSSKRDGNFAERNQERKHRARDQIQAG